MRRIERWMAPLVLCTVAACAAPKDRVGWMEFEKPGEDIADQPNERGVERKTEPSDEARLTKQEACRWTFTARNVGPPRRSRCLPSTRRGDPRMPHLSMIRRTDLCEDFYYELCETHANCDDGYFCREPEKSVSRVTAAAIDTGDTAECTRAGLCERG